MALPALVVGIVAAGLSAPLPLRGQTVTLPAAGDTYLKSGSPNQNQGQESILRLQSSGTNRALVRFDEAAILSAVGAGSLASARLELFIAANANNWGPDGRTVDAHRVIEPWSELGATWNCGIDANPSNGGADCASPWGGGHFQEEPTDTVLHTNGLTGWIAFDVTVDVATLLAGDHLEGWIVKKTEEAQTGRVDYASREAGGGNGPHLVLVVESAEHDEVPPRVAITSPSEHVVVNEPAPVITLEYSDGGSGVDQDSLEVLLDGVDMTTTCSVGPSSASCAPGNLGAGSHTIEAALADLAGNQASASFSFELLIGSGLHTVRIPLVADTYLRQGSPNQNQGSETLVRLQQSGKNRALLRVDPTAISSLLAGATIHSARLELYIVDNGANWGSAGRTVGLHRATAPWSEGGATWNCAVDANPTNQQADCSPQWSGGSFEPTPVASLLVTNGLGGWVDFDVTADATAMATDSAHEGWLLKKTLESQSGRVEFASQEGPGGDAPGVVVVFEISAPTSDDTVPPSVVIEAPAAGALLGTDRPELVASYSDSGSGVDLASVGLFIDGSDRSSGAVITLDGLAYQLGEALADGAHVAVVVLRDLAGNPAQATSVFVTDVTLPDLTIVWPPDGYLTNRETLRVAGTATDVSGLEGVEVNGQTTPLNPSGEFETEVTLDEGSNQVTVQAVDTAGNVRELATQVRRFSLPEVAISSPADLVTIASTVVDVEGTTSEGATVSVNGVPAIVTGTAFVAPSVPLVEGGNVLTATAGDTQGHVATDSVSVVRDLTPPRLAIYQPRDGATLYEPTTAVQGLVNDIVAGTVNVSEVTVLVNGVPAQVSNRSFLADSVPLNLGDNLIEVVAVDEGGNTSQLALHVERAEPFVDRVVAISGSGQSAPIGTTLQQPLVVELRDAAGQPVPGRPVILKIRGSDGHLNGGPRRVAVTTDPFGRAQVDFTLGRRSGVGNQVVEAASVGFAGPAVFQETALPSEPALIVVDSGGQQLGVAGRELPRPLVAAVVDAGVNRLEGVPVRFSVIRGQGHFSNGLQELALPTDSDGRAIVPFTLDPEEGVSGNVVRATFEGQDEGPVATFVATGRNAGPPEETSISGIVLDNSNLPIPGVAVRIRDTVVSVETDAQGTFHIPSAPVGTVYLIVDGSTSDRSGVWPDLEFVLTTVSGRDNDIGMPIYLLPLDLAGGLVVDETHGGTITLPEMPEFALDIAPGSVTFPGGSRSGVVSVTVVHSDKVPMVPNFGQQPRFIVTIQPAGARFEPPARLTLPNVESLAPGAVTEFYSFDHDLGQFVSIGPATVSEDGLRIASDPGVGIVKAGWHCGGDPASSGTVHDCGDCATCENEECVPRPEGTTCPDDGNLCTKDTCANGYCVHRPVVCEECKKCAGGDCVADADKNGRPCGSSTGLRCREGECKCAVPVNFSQDGAVLLAQGAIQFHYKWESSTGEMLDLAGCRIGEEVTYAGGGSSFEWPLPWVWTDPNPRVNLYPAIGGGFFDVHSSPPLFPPYQVANVTANQRYVYECQCHNSGERTTLLGGIVITREVRQLPGAFEIITSKSGVTNVWSPLP